jgi:hypothetical protein
MTEKVAVGLGAHQDVASERYQILYQMIKDVYLIN